MLTQLARATAALLMLCASLTIITSRPVEAAGYRDLKSVRFGSCLYAYRDPLEDLFLMPCRTKPARHGNWAITRVGYYNNHPLWVLKRQRGTCLGTGIDSKTTYYLYSSCSAKHSANVWEVFTTKSGRYVLKSFGAYQKFRLHLCLNFDTPRRHGKPHLGTCSLTNTADQIYK